ncbi:MAG: NAD(P)-binding protein [Endomicrobium sp.]|jgi:protoporphyrinogen oxidase|nr:NAD(P)-binding protein [Endomicrobium sp.]
MQEKILIIGAGISGLTTAYFLKKPYEVLEAKPYTGGLCASFHEDGFVFDCSGHFIHVKDKEIERAIEKLTGGLLKIERNASIYAKNKFIPYPFQANLYYLDEKTKKECIEGILKRKDIKISTSMPFLRWSEAMFGAGITKYFMKPYNHKLWSYDLTKMTAEWTGEFVPKPCADAIIETAYSKNKKKYGYNSVFYYPEVNGCGALIGGLTKKVKVNLNSKVEKIDVHNKIVFCSSGKIYKYNKIVSTQALPELIKQITNVAPNVKKAVENLLSNSVRCVNIGIKSEKGVPKKIKDKHWIYFPESQIPFYRAGVYSNVNNLNVPKGSYSFYVEFSSFNKKYKNVENLLDDFRNLEFIRRTDKIIALNIIDMPYAYVIFDDKREKSLQIIKEFLKECDIFSIGRYGAWEYSFIEKNIQDAKSLADMLNKNCFST